MAKPRKKPVQLTLDSARKLTGQGGWRPGSGRPRGRKTVPHDKRPDHAARYPIHVTWRICDGVPSLRRDYLVKIMRLAFTAASNETYRVVEFSVQGNHLHLLVEAANAVALQRGQQGLGVRLARGLNKKLKRSGKLLSTRYHARALKTPREVRNVLRYVLLNARHHADERGQDLAKHWFDPYSSAAWFDGWKSRLRAHADWRSELVRLPRPTARATTWLLTTGWRKHGLLSVDEVPGRSG